MFGGCHCWGGAEFPLTEHENFLQDRGTQSMDVRVGKPGVAPGWREQEAPRAVLGGGCGAPTALLKATGSKTQHLHGMFIVPSWSLFHPRVCIFPSHPHQACVITFGDIG